MKNLMKRTLTMLLAFTLCVSMLQLTAFAEEIEPAAGNSGDITVTQEPAEKPAETPEENPAENSGEKPAENPAETPEENPAENSGEKPAENPAENPAEKPVENPEENPAENPGEAPETAPGEDPAELPEENIVSPLPEEVPPEVQAFLDAVAKLPSDITPENAEEAAELIYGEVSEAYEALLGTEYENRDDVLKAAARYAAAVEAVDAALDLMAGAYETGKTDVVKSADSAFYPQTGTWNICGDELSDNWAETGYGQIKLANAGDTMTDDVFMHYYRSHMGVASPLTYSNLSVDYNSNRNAVRATVTQENGHIKVTFEKLEGYGAATIIVGYTCATMKAAQGSPAQDSDWNSAVSGQLVYTVSGDSTATLYATSEYSVLINLDEGTYARYTNLNWSGKPQKTGTLSNGVMAFGEDYHCPSASYGDLYARTLKDISLSSYDLSVATVGADRYDWTGRYDYDAAGVNAKGPRFTVTGRKAGTTKVVCTTVCELPYVENGMAYYRDLSWETTINIKVVKTEPEHITLTYHDGGMTAKQTGPAGTFEIYPPLRENEGYTFKGWAETEEDAESGKVKWEAGKEYPFTEDTDLYAVWEEDDPFDNSEVSVSKTPDEEYPVVGKAFTYTITVNNANSTPLNGVTITDVLRKDLDFVSASDGGQYNEETRTVTWTGVDVPANGSKDVTLTVKANAAGKIYNEAKAEWTGGSSSGNTTIGAKAEWTVKWMKGYETEGENPWDPAIPDTVPVKTETIESSTVPTVPGEDYPTDGTMQALRDDSRFIGWGEPAVDEENRVITIIAKWETTKNTNTLFSKVFSGGEGLEDKVSDSFEVKITITDLVTGKQLAEGTLNKANGLSQRLYFNYVVEHGYKVTIAESNYEIEGYTFKSEATREETTAAAPTPAYSEGMVSGSSGTNTFYNVYEKNSESPDPDKKGIVLVKKVNGKDAEALTVENRGEELTYTITVTNGVNVDLKEMLIRDKMPEGLSLVGTTGTVKVGDGEAQTVAVRKTGDYCDWPVPGVVADKAVVVLTYKATVAAEGEVSLKNAAKAFAKQNDAAALASYVMALSSDNTGAGLIATPDGYDDSFQSNTDDAVVTAPEKPKGPDNPDGTTYTVRYSWSGLPAEASVTPPQAKSYEEKAQVAVDSRAKGSELVVNGTTYVFSGWSTSDATVENGGFQMPGKDVAFTGSWSEKPKGPDNPDGTTYTVRYSWSGLPAEASVTPPDARSYAEGDRVTVDTGYARSMRVTVGGRTYVFSGWDRSGSFEMPAQNVTITGSWSVRNRPGRNDRDDDVEIEDDPVPLAPPADDTFVEIPDEAVPLAGLPGEPDTGIENHGKGLWAAILAGSLTGLFLWLRKDGKDAA